MCTKCKILISILSLVFLNRTCLSHLPSRLLQTSSRSAGRWHLARSSSFPLYREPRGVGRHILCTVKQRQAQSVPTQARPVQKGNPAESVGCLVAYLVFYFEEKKKTQNNPASSPDPFSRCYVTEVTPNFGSCNLAQTTVR